MSRNINIFIFSFFKFCNIISNKGLVPIFNKGFGVFFVILPNLLPNPPANIKAAFSISVLSSDNIVNIFFFY